MEERRKWTRKKSFLQGRILYNNRCSTADCLIRDITEAGARLKFSDAVTVPEVFELFVPNKHETFRAHVIWHHGDEMGVTLTHADVGPIDSPSIVSSGASLEERVAKLEHDVVTLRRKLDAIVQVVPGAELG